MARACDSVGKSESPAWRGLDAAFPCHFAVDTGARGLSGLPLAQPDRPQGDAKWCDFETGPLAKTPGGPASCAAARDKSPPAVSSSVGNAELEAGRS